VYFVGASTVCVADSGATTGRRHYALRRRCIRYGQDALQLDLRQDDELREVLITARRTADLLAEWLDDPAREPLAELADLPGMPA